MTTFREVSHPGGIVHQVTVKRGHKIGMVVVQDYQDVLKSGRFKVGSFLPGVMECSEGDTPKVWPEVHVYVADQEAAMAATEEQVKAALADGWSLHDLVKPL